MHAMHINCTKFVARVRREYAYSVHYIHTVRAHTRVHTRVVCILVLYIYNIYCYIKIILLEYARMYYELAILCIILCIATRVVQ